MIYVDSMMSTLRNRNWPYDEGCHLFCDVGELESLHEFASRIALKRDWFQHKPKSLPHYDLTKGKRWQAVMHGAIELDRTETVKRIHAWRAVAAVAT